MLSDVFVEMTEQARNTHEDTTSQSNKIQRSSLSDWRQQLPWGPGGFLFELDLHSDSVCVHAWVVYIMYVCLLCSFTV